MLIVNTGESCNDMDTMPSTAPESAITENDNTMNNNYWQNQA